jgi:hypothetical protein
MIAPFKDHSDTMANQLQKILYEKYINSRIQIQVKDTEEVEAKNVIQRYHSISYEHSGKFPQAIHTLPALEISDPKGSCLPSSRQKQMLYTSFRPVSSSSL